MSFPTNFTEREAQVAIMKLKGEIVDCSICFKPLLYKHSHNAYPVSDKRCCESCNYDIVIPARMKAIDGQD